MVLISAIVLWMVDQLDIFFRRVSCSYIEQDSMISEATDDGTFSGTGELAGLHSALLFSLAKVNVW